MSDTAVPPAVAVVNPNRLDESDISQGLVRYLAEAGYKQDELSRLVDHRDFILARFAEPLQRPDLLDACIPSYPPYGKRILLDKGWFKALCRPNVELVTEHEAARGDDGGEHGRQPVFVAAARELDHGLRVRRAAAQGVEP